MTSLLLIGLRGSGKTTIGRLVAQRGARHFLDLDELVLEDFGLPTVAEIWEEHGEAAFREAETRLLGDRVLAADAPAAIVALGGGAPTAPGALPLLEDARDRGRAVIAYLRGTPETLRARLQGSEQANRPSLTGRDPLAEIDEIFAARDPLYRKLASHVLEIDDRSIEHVAASVEGLLP